MNPAEYVLQNQLCSGCAACTQCSPATLTQSHVMQWDNSGFLRPPISIRSIDPASFSTVCPGYSQKLTPSDNEPDEWGPVIEGHIGWASDPIVRHSGSSGGGITAAATALLDLNLVDAVLHLGPSELDPIQNEYKISTTAAELLTNCGSRYAPGSPLSGYLAAVSKFKRLLIVGKPCEIYAARALAKIHSLDESHTLIYFSFFCAGLPSIGGTHKILQSLDVAHSELASFRYRGNGWPGFATAVTHSGKSHRMSYEESWGRILNKHLQLRCKICSDGTGEYADISFADAWLGTDDGYPSFEEQEGKSLVLIRTKTGTEVFERVTAAGHLVANPASLADLPKMQPYQFVRKRLLLSRIAAMRLLGLGIPTYSMQPLLRGALSAGVRANFISFLGMIRRGLAIRSKRRRANAR